LSAVAAPPAPAGRLGSNDRRQPRRDDAGATSTLRDALEARPSGYPAAEAVALCVRIADAAARLHARGISHQNLTTTAIVFDRAGGVQLAEPGVAGPTRLDVKGHLTRNGRPVSAPEYLSPEQCRGEEADVRSDVYTLGVVGYELFTGQVPFLGETLIETLLGQLQEPPPFDTEQGSRVPAPARAVLDRALAKDPGDRYATAGELGDALRSVMPGGPLASHSRPETQGDGVSAPKPASLPRATHAGDASGLPARDRRRESRLRMPVDLRLKRLGPDGGVVNEERTVAENISRGGARVLTSIETFRIGDRVRIELVSGDFACEAEVRNETVGSDRVRRLGLAFLGERAPLQLIGDFGETAPVSVGAAAASPPVAREPRSAPSDASKRSTDGGSEGDVIDGERRRERIRAAFEGLERKNHFEVLGVARSVSDAELKEAYRARVREYHPDGARQPGIHGLSAELNALLIRAGEAFEALKNPVRRRDYAASLAPVADAAGPSASRAGRAREDASHRPPPSSGAPTNAARPGPSESEAVAIAERVISEGKKLIAAEKFWDAIVLLEPALPTAPCHRLGHAMQVLLARATIRNPKWVKRGEEMLLRVIGEDPKHLEAQLELARLYRSQGMRVRAKRTLEAVLAIQPDHAAAVAELGLLEEA